MEKSSFATNLLNYFMSKVKGLHDLLFISSVAYNAA